MKKAYLYQLAFLNTGVVGILTLEGKEYPTLETQDCLPVGNHKIKLVDGRYRIGKDYYITMDCNGLYRTKGLVAGKKWDFRHFDVMQKGDAIQEILKHVCPKKGLAIEVTRSSETQKDTINRLQKDLEQMEEDYQLVLETQAKTWEAIIGTKDEELELLRSDIEVLKRYPLYALELDGSVTAEVDKLAKDKTDVKSD